MELGEERMDLSCISKSLFTIEGKSALELRGSNLWRGHGGELLTDLLIMTCLACSYRTQNHHPSGGNTHSDLDPPTLVTKKMPHRLSYNTIL